MASTKTLTKLQLEHAEARLAARLKEKIAALGDAPTYAPWSFKEKYQMIANGKAKLKALDDVTEYTDLHKAYTYPERPGKAAYEVALKKYQAKVAVLSKQKQEILDKLVFVGSAEALALMDQYFRE